MLVPGRPLQPSLMFTSKEKSLPKSGARERSFTQEGSSHARKHLTRLKSLARDKLVIRKLWEKSFITLGPGTNVIKLFVCNLQIYEFVPSKPFWPCQIFAGKAGALLGEASFRCSTLGSAPYLTRKHKTSLPGTNALAYYENS